MSLTVKDVFSQADYLVSEASGLTLYPQFYCEEEITLEYDTGETYKELDPNTSVEPTSHGTVLILGTEYRAYVAQQIKFNTEV